MRVLLLGTGVLPVPPTGYGGVERTIAELDGALRRAGADVRILQRVRRGRSTDEYRFARELPKLLRGVDYDVVHAATPVVGNRLAGIGRRYVYTTHSRHWFWRHGWRQRWGYWLERRAVRRSAATVALTEPLAARIRSDLGRRAPSRMPVIPIGVDLERFRPAWTERSGRRALGVGVIARFKRWELAARALAGLPVELTLVGPIVEPAYAAELRSAGPHVRLAGEIGPEALARQFATSDLLVHPSAVELLPGAVLQGLASGLPVLGGAAIAGLVESGRTGFVLSEPTPGESFVATLRARAQALFEDEPLRRRMGEAARAAAEARYAWPVVAERHLELYRTVAERG